MRPPSYSSAAATSSLLTTRPAPWSSRPRPGSRTSSRLDIVAAGPKGLEVPLTREQAAALEVNCIGTAPPYVGTAGHCVAGGGNTVIAQVATRVDPTDTVIVTLAAIGTTARSSNQGIGKDFAVVKINPGFKVIPGVDGGPGPTGALCLDPVGQPVMHYGHGYIFFVEQGHPKFGQVVPDLTLVFEFISPVRDQARAHLRR